MKTYIPFPITRHTLLLMSLGPSPIFISPNLYIYISIIFLIFSDKAFFAFFIATQGGAPPLSVSLDYEGIFSDITG
jgi:hypothetical protein